VQKACRHFDVKSGGARNNHCSERGEDQETDLAPVLHIYENLNLLSFLALFPVSLLALKLRGGG